MAGISISPWNSRQPEEGAPYMSDAQVRRGDKLLRFAVIVLPILFCLPLLIWFLSLVGLNLVPAEHLERTIVIYVIFFVAIGMGVFVLIYASNANARSSQEQQLELNEKLDLVNDRMADSDLRAAENCDESDRFVEIDLDGKRGATLKT